MPKGTLSVASLARGGISPSIMKSSPRLVLSRSLGGEGDQVWAQLVKDNQVGEVAKKKGIKNKVDIRTPEERALDHCPFRPLRHSKLRQFLSVIYLIWFSGISSHFQSSFSSPTSAPIYRIVTSPCCQSCFESFFALFTKQSIGFFYFKIKPQSPAQRFLSIFLTSPARPATLFNLSFGLPKSGSDSFLFEFPWFLISCFICEKSVLSIKPSFNCHIFYRSQRLSTPGSY